MDDDIIIQDGFWYINNSLVNYTGIQEDVVIPYGTVEILDPFSNINRPRNYEETEIDKIKSITIPASVTKIDSWTFCRLYNLEVIHVDKDNKYFSSENGALFNKKKTELISFPQKNKNVKYVVPEITNKIAGKAFWDNEIVEEILLPEGIKKINPQTFYGCLQLKRINIPNSVISIGKYAFYYCNSLYELNLSSNIIQIGYSAFTKLHFGQDEIGAFATMDVEGFTIKCPKNCFAEKYAREYKINFEYI
jgi:hypothetical protein